ncbi:MAG: hypothetical protein RIS08_269 [Actinomycetota bacterium]|jgi:methionine-rich copper-binding protein CopC
MKLIRVLVALLLVAIPLPANAHDQLVDQVPKPNSVVEAGRVLISLDFNNDLLNLSGSGAEILVTGPEGNLINKGCGVVEGKNARLEIELDQPGEYQVAWRVVSSDGHPITDSFSFTLVNGTGFVADPNFEFVACEEQVLIASNEEAQDPAGYWLLWVSLGLVAAGLFFYLRPNRKR